MPLVQIIIDDSTSKVITGTYEFDRAGGGTLVVPSGSAFPSTPAAGELFWRTDESKLYRRNNSNNTWEALTAVATAHATTHEPGGTDQLAVDAAANTGSLRTLGAGAQQACAGNDSRLSDARAPTTHASSHKGDGADAIAIATMSVAGLMSASDKTKLDGVATGATNTPLSSTAPVNVTKATASAGSASEAARQDHKHDISTATAGSATPGDTALEGTATTLARSDHRHSLPAFGSTAGTFCQGNDSRLSDARTPTAHATSHHSGGSDQLSHQSISGAGANTHTQIDTHLASTSNPHSTTASQVGLGNVTNDAQLKRAAGDFATFAEKSSPASTDILLLEDSADSGNKKWVQIGNLSGSSGTDPNAIHKNVAGEISTITEKTAPADADLLVIEDSNASNAKKRVQIGNLPRRWRWGSKILTVDADSNAKADYTTIQSAIDAASSGTVILIAPGTYTEKLTLKDGVSLIGQGSRRYGGQQVSVYWSDTAGFDVMLKNSPGTAYLENMVVLGVLSGTSSGTVTALRLTSGGVRAKDCLFQATTDASAGTQTVRGVLSAGYMQASECLFVAVDSASRNTAIAALAISGTLEADRSKFRMMTSSSNEGALLSTGGTHHLWNCFFEAGSGGQPIRHTGGTVNLYGVQYVSGTEADDTDDPASTTNFPKSAYGVLLTNGAGQRAYKLPCRALASDPASPQDGDIWYNSTSNAFRCRENGVSGNLRGGSGDTDAIHKSVAAEISTITEKTSLALTDLFLIEDSAGAYAKKRLQADNLLPAFGRDFQSAVSENTSTTTSSTFQTKVTLTTAVLTGTYKISWQAELTIASTTARFQARLYNTTDATALCFHDAPAVSSGAYKLVTGFAFVTLYAASKSFAIQFASQNNSTTVTIRRARIEIYRVT